MAALDDDRTHAPTAQERDRVALALERAGIFAGLAEAAREALARRLQVTHIAGGDVLFDAGDEPDALYLVVSGRLRVLAEDGAGVDVPRGRAVGEIGLITGEPRTARVVATRDTMLATLAREDFLDLLAAHPEDVVGRFAGPIISALRSQLAGRHRVDPGASVITVLALPDQDADAFGSGIAEQLAAGTPHDLAPVRATVVTRQRCVAETGLDPSGEGASSLDLAGIALWLDDLEAVHEHVVLVADVGDEAWARRSVRHADRVVVAGGVSADASSARELAEIVRRGQDGSGDPSAAFTSPAVEAVVIHPTRGVVSGAPAAARWTTVLEPSVVHHARAGHVGDLGRVARLVSGRGVGVVLSGGGARAMAHIGVLRALDDAGIPVDAIAAVSGGAIVGGLAAMGCSHDELVTRSRAAIDRVDYTLPLHALTRGRTWTGAMQRLFGDVRIEDCWTPFVAVSTNLTRARLHAHDRGSLATAVRASTAIPGVLPPVHHEGHVLVDGGIVDNLPTDLMRARRDVARVIAVDVGIPNERGAVPAFPSERSGWRTLLERLRPGDGGESPPPSIGDVMLRSLMIANAMSSRDAGAAADLVITPPVQSFGLLGFERVEELAAVGHAHATTVLGQA